MSHALEQSPSTWTAVLIEPIRESDAKGVVAKKGTPQTHDLTSMRIQSLAGRGLIDPKSLKLREIQELSASIVAHIRERNRSE